MLGGWTHAAKHGSQFPEHFEPSLSPTNRAPCALEQVARHFVAKENSRWRLSVHTSRPCASSKASQLNDPPMVTKQRSAMITQCCILHGKVWVVFQLDITRLKGMEFVWSVLSSTICTATNPTTHGCTLPLIPDNTCFSASRSAWKYVATRNPFVKHLVTVRVVGWTHLHADTVCGSVCMRTRTASPHARK